MVHMIVLLALLALTAAIGGFILGCRCSYAAGWCDALELVKKGWAEKQKDLESV